jgi:hypothetical protein
MASRPLQPRISKNQPHKKWRAQGPRHPRTDRAIITRKVLRYAGRIKAIEKPGSDGGPKADGAYFAPKPPTGQRPAGRRQGPFAFSRQLHCVTLSRKMQGYGDPPQTGAVSRASLDNSSRSRSRSALAAAKGLSLNNRIGWWRGDPFTPSCRRRACPQAKAGVGIHVCPCCDQQDVDGRPAPAMTRWASIARSVKQLSGVGP